MTIVGAMRKLFDCFKPGGEGQVISRIIESFSESYFRQCPKGAAGAETALFPNWRSADSAYSFGFALIMLNTDLHVMARLMKRQNKEGLFQGMTVREFIENTR